MSSKNLTEKDVQKILKQNAVNQQYRETAEAVNRSFEEDKRRRSEEALKANAEYIKHEKETIESDNQKYVSSDSECQKQDVTNAIDRNLANSHREVEDADKFAEEVRAGLTACAVSALCKPDETDKEAEKAANIKEINRINRYSKADYTAGVNLSDSMSADKSCEPEFDF